MDGDVVVTESDSDDGDVVITGFSYLSAADDEEIVKQEDVCEDEGEGGNVVEVQPRLR